MNHYAPPSTTLTAALVDQLRRGGITHAFGVSGATIGRFTHAADAGGLWLIHTRHEAGAAFIATELSLATGQPGCVFTTSGPGWTNALTGLVAGVGEGVHLVCVIGGSVQGDLGRGAFQETGPRALEIGGLLPEDTALERIVLRSAEDLARLARVLALPVGGRGRLTLVLCPVDTQQLQAAPAPTVRRMRSAASVDVDAAVEALEGRRVVVWAGHGARQATTEVRALVDHLGAAVLTTPRGKGIVAECHPAWAGVTGMGGNAHPLPQAEVALVLGSRLSQFASYFDRDLVPPGGLVHVDCDPTALGRTLLGPTVPVVGDVAAVCRALRERLSPGPGLQLTAPTLPDPPPATRRGLHPAALMAAVQERVVEGSEVPVISEAGNAFAWASHALRFDTPRYRVSTAYGAMGHASAGVVGMALAHGRAVALLGDGALLMTSELSTAVSHQVAAVWVVLNDAAYGMIRHGMEAIGLPPVDCAIPRVDFVAWARAQGADGAHAHDASSLASALDQAMEASGPFVVDVRIDPEVAPPFGRRNQDLVQPRPAWQG